MAYLPRVLLAAAALHALVALAPAQSSPLPEMSMVGTAKIGSACLLDVNAPQDQGMHYVIMLSMTDAHTLLPDGQFLPIGIDELTYFSVTPGNGLIAGNIAALHRGKGQALMIIPFIPSAVGARLYAAAMTFDPSGQGPLIRTVMQTRLTIDILPR